MNELRQALPTVCQQMNLRCDLILHSQLLQLFHPTLSVCFCHQQRFPNSFPSWSLGSRWAVLHSLTKWGYFQPHQLLLILYDDIFTFNLILYIYLYIMPLGWILQNNNINSYSNTISRYTCLRLRLCLKKINNGCFCSACCTVCATYR